MPLAPMRVCLLSFLWMCIDDVLSVAPCDQKIIENLSKIPQCYPHGKPPKQMIPTTPHTYVLTIKGDLPANTLCIDSYMQGKMFNFRYISRQHNVIQNTYKHEVMGDHILETDKNGNKYKVYVIHNALNMYSYYRCIDSGEGELGNGEPEVEVAINCKVANMDSYNPSPVLYYAKSIVALAAQCIYHLGIPKVIGLRECFC